jgi:hypothetical protein
MEEYIEEYRGLDIAFDPNFRIFRVYDEDLLVRNAHNLEFARDMADSYRDAMPGEAHRLD